MQDADHGKGKGSPAMVLIGSIGTGGAAGTLWGSKVFYPERYGEPCTAGYLVPLGNGA